MRRKGWKGRPALLFAILTMLSDLTTFAPEEVGLKKCCCFFKLLMKYCNRQPTSVHTRMLLSLVTELFCESHSNKTNIRECESLTIHICMCAVVTTN